MIIRIFPTIIIGSIIAIYYQNINIGLQLALILEIIIGFYFVFIMWYRGNRPTRNNSFLSSLVWFSGGQRLPQGKDKVYQEITARITLMVLTLISFDFIAILLVLTFIHEK